MTIEEKLKQMENVIENATPEPWYKTDCDEMVEVTTKEFDYICGGSAEYGYERRIIETDGNYYGPKELDAQFIIQSRRDWPRCVRALDAAVLGLKESKRDEVLDVVESLLDGEVEKPEQQED